VYKVEEQKGYDASDPVAAFKVALEWGDRIATGVLYRSQVRPTFEEQTSALAAGSLVDQPVAKFSKEQLETLRADFC